MELSLSPTQSRIRDLAREYSARVLAPRAAATERAERIDPAVLRELAGLGLMGVNLPAALGGAEAGVVAYALAMREVARGCAATAVTMAVTNMVGEVIRHFGTPEQVERHVTRLARGEYLAGAFALSEPEAGSDPGSMRTTATRDGDGWVIRGAKQWITSGDIAGVFVVWARTGGPGTAGISCFLVEGGAPGLRVGRHEDKMGLRGSTTVPLEFDDVRVGADALLGVEGGGFRIAMMALDGGRIGIGAQATGVASAALALAAREASRNAAADALVAECQTDVDAAWLLVLRAAWLKESGRAFSAEAAMAKVFASEAGWRVTNRALEALGPGGDESAQAAARHLRDVRVTMIYEGTSEVQRIVIARSLVK